MDVIPQSDPTGTRTLQVISEADKFNQWMFETIQPFTKGEILEIGSGLGNISKLFVENNSLIYLSDIREDYCKHLGSQYGNLKNFSGVEQIDLVHPHFDTIYEHLFNRFDSLFALNVVEHIKNDQKAIANCKKLLKKNGHLIILVPSYPLLYNHFDKELGHFRRYTKNALQNLFFQNNIEVIHKQNFNMGGVMGWYISGNILKNKSIPSGQMKFYNSLVPLFKLIDKIFLYKIGLSTIVVGRK